MKYAGFHGNLNVFSKVASLFAISFLIATTFVTSCAAQENPTNAVVASSNMEGFSPAQQFEIVDCLFPGQVRTVGGRVYMTPRRPGRTTVADCKLRGGEFTLYDRTNNKASLNVWLPEAESGNVEAMTYVGMLYEKGIDDAGPDYVKAIDWYRKAAEEGHSPAKYSLGTMYERGLGVERDMNRALNLYREAQGVSDDNLIFQSNANAMIIEERARLQAEIDERDTEVAALRQQVQELQERAGADSDLLQTLQGIVDRLESEKQSNVQALHALPATQPVAEDEAPPISPAAAQKMGEKEFGRYYALIIGVQDYQPYPRLTTVQNDVDRAERILADRYGFSVTRLINPSRHLVLEAVNAHFGELGENDNLLIYFAGQGETLSAQNKEFGYWLPTDADAPPNDTNWIANELITDHLARLKARRILVVSDSIYVDVLESSPGVSVHQDKVSKAYLDIKLPRRSRLLLASGTEKPVAYSDGRHSRFADAFLDVLENNEALIHVPALFRQIKERLDRGARMSDPEPSFRTIKSAYHELGDFFFVPSLN